MSLLKTVKLLLTVVFALPLILSAAETVHLFDQFNQRDRDTQNLPQSARWYATSRAGVRMVADGSGGYALNIGGGDPLRGAVAYFTAAHAPVVLENAGDKLTLEADFTPGSQDPVSHAAALRIALLHSGDDRIRRDELGDVNVSGYGFMIDPQAAVIRYRVRDAQQGNYISTFGNYAPLKLETGLIPMVQGTTYAIKVEIERLANDNLKLTFTMSDGSATASNSFESARFKFYSFDTVAFGANPRQFGDLIVDNVKITSKK